MTNAGGLLFPAGDLSLQQHLDLLGIDAGHLSFLSKVPEKVITRAAQGGHIAQPYAEVLCKTLSKEHGTSGGNVIGIQPEHLKDLQMWKLDPKHSQTKNEDDSRHK